MYTDLSIVIINYNTKNVLRDCINSIFHHATDITFEVIVVDNNCSDESREMLMTDFPDVLLIANNTNVGFEKANNKGIGRAAGNNILLLNSDTLLIDSSLGRAISSVSRNKKIGVVGCRVLNHDGSLQYSCFHSPTIISEIVFFTKTIVKDFWDPISYIRFMKYWDHKHIRSVGCISGCFMLVRKEVFEVVGLLDTNDWQDRGYVLKWFGSKEGEAKRAYRRFVKKGNRSRAPP